MSVWRGIRSDLRSILLGVTGVPDIRFEGRSKIGSATEPTAGIAYMKERISKGNAITETMGAVGMTREDGIYMLDLYWPATAGMNEGEDLADRIRLAFYHGRTISASGPDFISGHVDSSSARDIIEGDGWLIFPIRVEFWVRRYTRQAA